MRLASYNVHEWEDADGRRNDRWVADVLREQRCDVVALQEVPIDPRRDRGALEAMAEDLDMRWVEAAAGEGLRNVLLFRADPIASGSVPLLVRGLEPRSVAWAMLPTPWGAVTFLATHFDDGSEDARLRQLSILLSVARASGPEAVILGDLNSLDLRDYPARRLAEVRRGRREAGLEDPRRDVVAELARRGWVDLARKASGAGDGTLSADLRATSAYDTRVDYAWATPLLAGAMRASAWVPAEDVSDHRPLVVEIEPSMARAANPRKARKSRGLPDFLATDEAAWAWTLSSSGRDLPDEEDDPEGYEAEAAELRARSDAFAAEARKLCAQDEIEVCRSIAVPRDASWRDAVVVGCLGKSWSSRVCGTGVYGRVPYSGATRPIRMKGLVSAHDVEWDVGLIQFLEYGGLEWEIPLRDDAPVRLAEVDGERLDPPIAGSAGTHGEDWTDGCGGAVAGED